jgi:hypothetical protein
MTTGDCCPRCGYIACRCVQVSDNVARYTDFRTEFASRKRGHSCACCGKPCRSAKVARYDLLLIDALKRWRCDYAVGHNAYMEGRRLLFGDRDHKKYEEITRAIEELERW